MSLAKTAGELARLFGAVVEGDSAVLLSGVAPLDTALPSDLAFVQSDRNLNEAMQSRAGCLLAPEGLRLPGKTVIRVPYPHIVMATAIGLLRPKRVLTRGIHPTAQIGANVAIADDVGIGPFCSIGDRCRIASGVRIGAGSVVGDECVFGEDCLLHPRVTLYDGAKLGARVILHSGVVIGSDGFGYVREGGKYHKFPQVGTVEIGDDVEVGANTTVDRAALGVTRIGRGTKIDNLVQVGHNVVIGENCAIAAQVGISGSVVIGDNVVIAGQVGIGDHARIESGVVLGGQCGILPHKVVKAGEPLWGTPARPLREHLKQQATLGRLAKRTSRRKD